MTIQIDSLETSTKKIIYSDKCKDILSLSVAEIQELFKSSGILLFRGFGVTHEQMKAFSKQFSSRFTRETNRTRVDSREGFVSLVAQGTHFIEPHCENANTPFRPDAVWFCCGVPPAQGGETLFCDGVQVWEQLSEESKQLFLSKKIRFDFIYSAEQWKHFLGAEATLANVKQMLEGLEGVSYFINEDESVSFAYACPAVIKTKYSNQDAFANNILNAKESVFFENGSPIPDTIISEIEEVTDRLTEEIQWQVGDLVMIDNSRFLHGRRSFSDNQRLIFSIFSYLNF
ncbi:MAG: TauD/TfdA family dioxygenase [Nostoc sp.]|uniref:TauD/TfdA dioxygenase family protein n=1 Tax=Nostoc sp. TaxID=1180 RepID=UPI002FF51B31